MTDVFEQNITDITNAIDNKYVYLNAFNAGINLPKIINDYIGYGSCCPMNKLRDVQGHEDVAMAVGFGKINSDIYLSLSTPLGTRFMNPNFGSELYKLLFEPYDQILIDAVTITTKRALTKDVHSIQLVEVFVDDSQQLYNLLNISITYQIVNTPLSNNYVFPFVTSAESYS